MNKLYLITLIFIKLLFITNTAFAGSRDGYYLLAFPLDLESELKLVPTLKKYFNHKYDQKLYDNCNSGNGVKVELAYLKKRPKSLKTDEVAKAIQGDREALKLIRKIIGEYRDEEIENGFDALITYRLISNKIEFWGIAPTPGEKKTMSISQSDSDENIAKAICDVLSPLPYAFGP